MKKYLKLVAVACLCACAIFAFAGCACSSQAPQQPSKSSGAVTMNTSETPVKKEVTVSNDPVYVLAIGSDTRYGTIHQEEQEVKEGDPSYADVMILMRLDPKNERVSLLSLPRDTLVDYEGEQIKLNEVHYEGGVDALLDKVGELFGIKVPYYFEMTFATFEDFIDDYGGVTVNVPIDMTWDDEVNGGDISLSAGEGQTLNGPEALVLGRVRKLYQLDGEANRQWCNRDMVESMIKEVSAKPKDEAQSYAQLLEMFSESNMDEDTLKAYLEKFMGGKDIAIQSGTAPYVGDFITEDLWGIYTEPDMFKTLVEAMENDDDINELVPPPGRY